MSRNYKTVFLLAATLSCIAVVTLWWVVFEQHSALGSTAKWLARSHQYKAEVLALPEPTQGELKHVEWDGWGWGGQDTTVYLAFDPTDSLSQAASSHQPGKYNGMTCEVFLVRRLQSHWYTVQFYTNQDWRPNC